MAVASLFDAVFFLQENGLQYGLRADFVEALGFIDHSSSYEALLQLVQHDDPSVCHEAVRALGRQSHPSVDGDLEKIAASGKDEVGRWIAKRVLERRAQ
jgi:HEAT repeat protein